MPALLGATIIWHPDDYIFFKKCGEITISPDVQNIGFNCLFCTGICLQTDIFLQHLQEQHKEEVIKLYENQNSITTSINEQEFLTNNCNKELKVTLNGVYSTLITTNSFCITNNQLATAVENQEFKENCINLNAEEIMTPTTDLSLVNDIETNCLLTLTSPNQDLENLITLNPLENLTTNATIITSTNTSSLTSIETATFSPPPKGISATPVSLKCLPNDNVCEIGDGEDSGIMLVQSPCNSDCGGFSDCMSITEDNSSKLNHTFNENCLSPSPSSEHIKQAEMRNTDTESPKPSKGKYLKTAAMRKALNNKDLIKYLLEAYRKNEKLWNPKNSSYKYNAHRTIYNELSQPLLNDMKYSLTGEEIFGIINELRARYRRELKKIEARKGKHKTRLWYFQKMEFLREIIEEKRKERNKEKDVKKVFNTHDTDLSNRQILSYLLDFYRQYEMLWNPNHMNYGSCNKMEICQEIAEQLKIKLKIVMTDKECFNEIQKLRIRYRKELGFLHKLKGLYLPKLWCFDEMEFLRPVFEEKIAKNLKKTKNKTFYSLNPRSHDFLKAVEIKFESLEQQLKFIEIYRSYNSLWEVDHPDYRSTNFRRKTLNKMLDKINLTFVPVKLYKLEHLEKTIYLWRKDFANEKQRRLAEKDLRNKESAMSFVLYEKLNEFLGINLGPFRCDTCQQIYKTYDQYKMHKSKHDGTLPFVCTLCGKRFQMPGNLTIHIRRHRKDFPYSCEICKKSFATSTEVNIHMRSHTGERPYTCEWCSKTFKTWSYYDLHRRTHLQQSNFHCPICDKSFYERNRFTDHMNIHLNIRKHECEQCGKCFTTLGNLKKHLDLHATVKKYKCQPCGSSFAQFASLRWHRKTQHEQ